MIVMNLTVEYMGIDIEYQFFIGIPIYLKLKIVLCQKNEKRLQ